MILILITLLCMASRIMFAGRYLEGWDSVDFALALHDYDLTIYQPHFPGYIVYIGLCRIALLVVNNDVHALVLPNVIFGSLTIIPLYFLTASMFSKKAAILTILLYMVNPLCWLQSEKPMPDTTGLFFLILAIQLLYFSLNKINNQKIYLATGSFVMGIALGTKLTFFPFIFALLFILWQFFRNLTSNRLVSNKKAFGEIFLYSIGSLTIGVCVWLLPLILSTGITNLFSVGINFVNGHFADWGGSIGTQNNLLLRIRDIYWSVFVNGLGFWWTDASFMRLVPSAIIGMVFVIFLYSGKTTFREIVIKGKSDRQNHIYFMIALILPYLIWIFLGQNLNKPRHALPLIPFFLILISVGIIRLNLRLPAKAAIIVILLAGFATISTHLIIKNKRSLPTQLQLINYVKDNFNNNSTRIYCWESKRLFEYYEPTWDARRVRNITDLENDLRSSLVTPKFVLCTSKIQGIKNLKEDIDCLKIFEQDRYINNVYNTLTLYSLNDNSQVKLAATNIYHKDTKR
ncbi:MAG: glycosyltransferase family 39 protein [Candidatus Anammoxibacter sp.]